MDRSYPKYSPDGKELAYVEGRCRLMVLDIESGKTRQITDGSQHYSSQGKEYDRKRTEVLEQYDIIVLRFSNQQVDEGFHWVTKTIDKTVKNRVLTKHCT